MTEKEKIEFLSKKIVELDKITKEIEDVFPEKSFKLDGILVGNIVEVMAAHVYGMKLYNQSEKAHDGVVDLKKIQIKGTQGVGQIVIRHEPDYLIVLFLDRDKGEITEIYNGPGLEPWKCSKYVSSMNQYTIGIRKLMQLSENVTEEDRIQSIVPIGKFKLNNKMSVEVTREKADSQKGKTVSIGYANKYNQENMGCLNKPGSHANQKAYQMKCGNCNYIYESNGCDIFLRKCPICMK